MAVNLTGKVTGKLSNLVVTRENNTIKAEWKIPGYLVDENYGRRLTSVDGYVDFNCNPDDDKRVVEVWKETFGVSSRKPLATTLNADHYFVRGLEESGNTGSPGKDFDKPYDRNRYYPKTSKKCTGVKVQVHGVNSYGSYDDTYLRGPNIAVTYSFTRPQKPAVEFTGWDSEANYRAAFTIDANPNDSDESKANAERYDTRYRIMRQDNLPNSGYAKRKAVLDWTATRSDGVESSVATTSGIRALGDGKWVEYTLEAYSRGMWGDSVTATSSIVASRPARAKIDYVKASSLSTVNGVVTVGVTIPSDDHRWTTQAKLQRLKNVDADKTASQVAALDGWTDVTGMAQINERYKKAHWNSAFCDSVASAYPSQNKRTWYRVVTENDLYSGDNAYMSEPVEARVLYHAATASDDTVYIEQMGTNDDATAIKMRIGWPSETPANTGTEVSWSVHEDAWESSELPTTALADWKDATTQGTHANSQSFTIYGLEPGTPYYVKARRYLVDENDETSYGPYATGSAANYPFTPAQPPKDVRLDAPAFVPRGSDVPLTWTFQSDAPQTAWAVYKVEYTTSNGVTSESGRTAVATGEDPYGACTVPANMLSGDSVHLAVSLTTGSSWATSDVVEVVFADPPEITVTFPSKDDPDYTTDYPLLMEQPMVLYASSATGDDMLHVRISSCGVTTDHPDGERSQLDGDSVFDAWVYPTWLEGTGGAYRCAVTLPEGLDLHDVGVYRWEVVARNTESGLESEAQTGEFKVRWAHQAHAPETTTVTVYAADRGVNITPGTPDNVAEGDVFDLYRVTPDGVDLIVEGLAFGSTVMDRFAPFGERVYRVCTRTTDGDIAWVDVPYTLDAKAMRLDFGSSFLELPYNLVRQDSWSKDFERRQHLDGERAGFWNEGASRDASLSTDLVRFSSQADQEALRELASYAGPVFVRLPNGCAFQANVDVGGMDESYNSGAVSVSLSAQQVALTDAYRIAPGNVVPPETDEYDPTHYGRSEIMYWSKTAPTASSTFTLVDEPASTVRVELTSSFDSYSDVWSVQNSVSGKVVTLGTFSSALNAYIAEAAAEECSFRLMARYDVEGE